MKKKHHSKEDINAFLRAIRKAVKLKNEGKRVKTVYTLNKFRKNLQ